MLSDGPRERVDLAQFSTLGIGGPARWFTTAGSVDEVLAAHAWARDRGTPIFVLGGGSNLVIADEGFDGLVLRMGVTGVSITERSGEAIVAAGAGESWDGLVERVVERRLTGIECLSGIPGTVGGTPIQNVGAYGQEVASAIEWVDAVDSTALSTIRLRREECEFGYRMSRFKQRDAGRFVVCEVGFRLCPGAPPTIAYPDVIDHLSRSGITSPGVREARDAVLAIRRRKGMVIDSDDPDTRSVGSFFMNPVVDRTTLDRIAPAPHYLMQNDAVKIPAAWLIEHSGFTCGHADGPVGLSTKHPLAIVNRGGATARDVLRLATAIKRAVLERFGIALRPEPVFVGFAGNADVEYLRG